jgi:hypothetical protein
MFNIQSRERFMVNTDPQRRCYDGCNYSEEPRWAEWRDLTSYETLVDAQESLERWGSIPMGHRIVEFRIQP